MRQGEAPLRRVRTDPGTGAPRANEPMPNLIARPQQYLELNLIQAFRGSPKLAGKTT
jgi:hypothetical protein